MKKLLPIPALLLFLGMAQAETDVSLVNTDAPMCVQVLQAAVQPDGECVEFPTPCDVPSGWKKVSSCNIVENKNFGKSLEERMQKRFSGLRRGSRFQKTEDTDESTKKNTNRKTYRISRIGRVKAANTQPKQKAVGKARTFTRKNYSLASRSRIKKLNTNKGGYQHEGDTTSEERTERRQNKRQIMSRAVGIRTGKLSNQPKWSTEVEKRDSSTGTALKNWKLSHINEMRKKLRAARKERIYEGPQLQKIWKGDRIQGDLEGRAPANETATDTTE